VLILGEGGENEEDTGAALAQEYFKGKKGFYAKKAKKKYQHERAHVSDRNV